MKIAIVDDEDLQRNTVHDLLCEELKKYYLPDLRIDLFSSGSEFLEQFDTDQYSIIILDIYMGDDFGVDVAKEIRKVDSDVIIVFCTTSNEFASESYQVNARYYLHKPISPQSIQEMIDRLDPHMLMNQRILNLPDHTRVRINHIMYTIYENHKVTFYLSNMKSHSVYMSQQEVEELLTEKDDFYSINRGMIVNFSRVKTLQKKDFIMNDDTALPISRGKFKDISSAFLEYKMKALSN